MSSVRVAYSGLIAFTVSILSVITGTIFVIMVTRKLDPEELGLWTLVGSIVAYVIIIRPIVTFWSTRQISRGEKVEKTNLFVSIIFSIIGTVAFLGLGIFYSDSLLIDYNIFLLASILIPLAFFHGGINSIAIAKKPQSISFGLIIFETIKIPVGLLFVVILDLGIIGAILTAILAESSRTILVIIMIRKYCSGKIDYQIIKFWFRMSWLTLYQTGAHFLRTLDVFVFSILSGSFIGLAYWGVGQTIATLVSHSEQITQGLYPKLLATQKKIYVEESITRTLLIAIPLFGASIIFAKPALHILNPIYIDGVLITIILSTRAFIFLLTNISLETLRSFEQIDIDRKTSFKKYFKSYLFIIPTIRYVFNGIYIASFCIFLYFFNTDIQSNFKTIEIWALIYLLTTIPITIFGFVKIRQKHQIKISYVPIMKYTIITIILSIFIYYLMDKYLEYSESVYDFIPNIMLYLILGSALYFGIMIVIDSRTKNLCKSILKEFRRGKKIT